MKRLAILFLLTSGAIASPTTQPIERAPTDPPVVPVLAPVADSTRPAYVPSFARPHATPALMDERADAYRNTYPAISAYPLYPYGIGAFYGRGRGTVINHGFYR